MVEPRRWSVPLAAILFLLSGCATKSLIEDAGKVEMRENSFTEVTHAWRTGEQTIVICIFGWPAKRDRLDDPIPYAFKVNEEAIAAAYADREPVEPGVLAVAELLVSPSDIGSKCDPKPNGAESVLVRNVERHAVDPLASVKLTDDAIREDIAQSPASEVLYVPDGGEGLRLAEVVLAQLDPATGDPHLVKIALPKEGVQPNAARAALLPIALADDAMAVIVNVVFWGGIILVIAVTI